MPRKMNGSKGQPAQKPNQLSSNLAQMPQSFLDGVASAVIKASMQAAQGYTAEPPIGKMAHSAYSDQPERGPMPATIEKRAKSNGVHGGTPKRTRLPEGRRIEARFARGLIRWRLKQGITSCQAAANQYGIKLDNWSRVERALTPGIFASHADEICDAIGVDFLDIYKLGLNE